MKKYFVMLLVAVTMLSSCGEEKKGGRGRINYTAIKEKAGITGATAEAFDKITEEYAAKGKEAYEKNKGKEGGENKENKEAQKALREQLQNEQDEKIKGVLTAEQFAVYTEEIKIERTGREKYNIGLIKQELALDSTQAEAYEQANAVFYKTLRDNHDSYHGKPDVYKQFYTELDKSRKEALKTILTKEQYEKYLLLVEKYKIGQTVRD